MKKFFKIQIEIQSSEESEIMIAALSENKYYAFEEENNFLNAYVTEEDFDNEKLKDILPFGSIFERHIIEEENWNQQWESQLKPVFINHFVAIRPSFHEAINQVTHDLIITPKMSFGTGHHATTHLMIELMEKMDFKNKTVVDFGTGTGVLSILAEKCGASKVVGVDYDEWSIKNASENIEANDCHNIILKMQNSLTGIDPVELVLANINLNVLKNEAVKISSITKTGSILVISGFLFKDEAEMENIFGEKGFVKIESRRQGDWVAILLEKN
jgi:ribosomal protein L11 methyltransferase